MTTVSEYVKNVVDSVKTTLVGMKITGKYLLQKPITVRRGAVTRDHPVERHLRHPI